MAEGTEREELESAAEVGRRLRALRKQLGWTLGEVEQRSTGEFGGSVVGAYERGERVISVPRLLSLLQLYGAPVEVVMPPDTVGRHTTASDSGVVIDLSEVRKLGPRWDALQRFIERIERQRGDFNGRVLSLRSSDLDVLAMTYDLERDALVNKLQQAGVAQRRQK